MSDGRKGDKQRPLGVTEEQFNSNWDTIFKKPEDFFNKARAIARRLDWIAEKGYEDHPISEHKTNPNREKK